MKLQPVRGTKDLRLDDIYLQNLILESAKQHAKLYNYEELATPIFEFSEVFHRTLGETSDVVSKETYTFMDRDKTSITLRPEFTAGVVRSFISSGLTQTLPQKYFSFGPVFRHERPQKARYRQFTQLNFEYLGANGAITDAETIILAYNILNSLGLSEHVTLELNSIGDAESRVKYREALVKYFSTFINDLSHDSQIRLEKNPLRILDSKDENDIKISHNAPKMHDFFTDTALNYYNELKDYLKSLNIAFVENHKLVRGLDYYTHTVFEFTTTKLGAQATVLAGGRYDGLVEVMGGPKTPAIGFAAGIERIAELIKETGFSIAQKQIISIIPIGESAKKTALKISHTLRNAGISVDCEIHTKISKMFDRANKIGAQYAIIFGDDELANNTAKVKNMVSGEEKTIAISDVIKSVI